MTVYGNIAKFAKSKISNNEMKDLVLSAQKTNNEETIEKIISHMTPILIKYSKFYSFGNIYDQEEMIIIGMELIHQKIFKWKPDMGTNFVSWVINEIKWCFGKLVFNGWNNARPQKKKYASRKSEEEKEEEKEIKKEIFFEQRELNKIIVENQVDRYTDLMYICELIDKLNPKEQISIVKYYLEGFIDNDIRDELGFSKKSHYAQNLRNRALNKLRRMHKENLIKDLKKL